MSQTMSYLAQARACTHYSLDRFRPFHIDGLRYGWVPAEFAQHLQAWPEVFEVRPDQVALHPSLTSYDARTDAVNTVVSALHAQGIIDTWVDERYPVVRAFDETPAFAIERAAVLYFGLLGFGVHMNGLVESPEGTHVWLGTRSHDKPFFPGQLDQMVAGGQPMGIGITENLIKECQEEANIPADIAQQAQARGQIRYMQETERGMDVSVIFVFDLWLPQDFTPENTDGEVESFALVPIDEVARLTDETTLFKDNCNLVNIDLLIRSGMITSEHPDFAQLTSILYATHDELAT
jgi:8-oxo-dGTP pyrophosphatase MutT (NUDIX family)